MSKSPLLQYHEAKSLILKDVESIKNRKIESVQLNDALNRIVAKPIVSPINVPSFNNSAMDGYLIRKQDLESDAPLQIAGTVLAGTKEIIDWPQNSCLRIMTGAAVPDEGHAVIMQENVEKHDNCIQFNRKNIKQGLNIRYIGESVKANTEIFPIGEKLTIPKLCTLASLGLNQINVFCPLKVAIFSTGDELTPIGESLPSANSIYDSNRFTVQLMLKSLGCEVIDLGIIKDDLPLITHTLKQAANMADIVLTSGGVSVGDADYTKKALENIGQINFWKIAMKPGKPFAFGKIGSALFCGLPGNPVSTLVTFYQLIRPLILALYGQYSANDSSSFLVKTNSNLKKSVGRLDFQRGYLHTNEQGELVVSSTGQQGSHITTSFNHANCFIILEKERGNVTVNEYVTVEPFDSIWL